MKNLPLVSILFLYGIFFVSCRNYSTNTTGSLNSGASIEIRADSVDRVHLTFIPHLDQPLAPGERLRWEFGDSSASLYAQDSQAVEHSFPHFGEFVTKLLIEDSLSNSALGQATRTVILDFDTAWLHSLKHAVWVLTAGYRWGTKPATGLDILNQDGAHNKSNISGYWYYNSITWSGSTAICDFHYAYSEPGGGYVLDKTMRFVFSSISGILDSLLSTYHLDYRIDVTHGPHDQLTEGLSLRAHSIRVLSARSDTLQLKMTGKPLGDLVDTVTSSETSYGSGRTLDGVDWNLGSPSLEILLIR